MNIYADGSSVSLSVFYALDLSFAAFHILYTHTHSLFSLSWISFTFSGEHEPNFFSAAAAVVVVVAVVDRWMKLVTPEQVEKKQQTITIQIYYYSSIFFAFYQSNSDSKNFFDLNIHSICTSNFLLVFSSSLNQTSNAIKNRKKIITLAKYTK